MAKMLLENDDHDLEILLAHCRTLRTSLDLENDPAVVAVSGGRDSMFLLWLLAQIFDNTLSAVTVDHDLRADSAHESEFVAAYCHKLGIQHTPLKWQHDDPSSAVQARARQARYQLMAQQCSKQGARSLWVAHHADDQAETFFQRLARGSGLTGLSAMSATRTLTEGLNLVRPLLNVTRSQITTWCADASIPYLDDPSNQNTNFERVRQRQILPQLYDGLGLSSRDIGRSVGRLSRAEMALECWVKDVAQSIEVTQENQHYVCHIEAQKWDGVPDEIQLRILAEMVERITSKQGQDPVSLSGLERVHQSLQVCVTNTINGSKLSEDVYHLSVHQCVFSVEKGNILCRLDPRFSNKFGC